MSMSPYYRVTLMRCNEFGPDGPQAGEEGRTVGGPIYDEDEVWYHVLFPGFPGAYYNVRDDMMTMVPGY